MFIALDSKPSGADQFRWQVFANVAAAACGGLCSAFTQSFEPVRAPTAVCQWRLSEAFVKRMLSRRIFHVRFVFVRRSDPHFGF
jgi:hypothetical protein